MVSDSSSGSMNSSGLTSGAAFAFSPRHTQPTLWYNHPTVDIQNFPGHESGFSQIDGPGGEGINP